MVFRNSTNYTDPIVQLSNRFVCEEKEQFGNETIDLNEILFLHAK